MEVNKAIKNLLELYNEDKLSHAYLLETNNENRCLLDLKSILKEIFKNIENVDNLIDKDYLPSVKIIKTDEKIIKKDDIDLIQKSFSLSSLYTNLNVYIIVNPEKMNSSAYNKMLKFLEEPEENIIGFFITSSKENIAPTILSRCEIIKVLYNDKNNFNEFNIDEFKYSELINDAKDYINKIELEKENLILYNNSVILKKYSTRVELINFVKMVYKIYLEDFNSKHNINDYNKLKIISKYLYNCQYNVNLSLFLNSLSLEIGELND